MKNNNRNNNILQKINNHSKLISTLRKPLTILCKCNKKQIFQVKNLKDCIILSVIIFFFVRKKLYNFKLKNKKKGLNDSDKLFELQELEQEE